MSIVDDGLAHGQAKLDEVRAAVGWTPNDGEPTDFDALELYIAALESHVVGTEAAIYTMRKTTI